MKNTIRCLIVDDEKIARSILKEYISGLPYLELVGECRDAFEALSILRSEVVDLLLLDIQMPRLSGVEMIRSLGVKAPLVIFTTANPDYAIDGYELDAVDYLVKPFRLSRFLQAIHKTQRRLAEEDTGTPEGDPTEIAYLHVKADHRIHKIPYPDILYVTSEREYVAFHLSSGKKILALMALQRLANELPADRFLQIHRSTLIPIKKVNAVNRNYVFIDGQSFKIGRSYRDRVLRRLVDQ